MPKKGLALFFILLFPALFYIWLSTGKVNSFTVPIQGPRDSVWVTENGERTLDTVIFHTIPEFRFQDQNAQWVSNATVKGKIYVADFFFTTCKSTCPQMSIQLSTVHEKFKDDDELLILSHTVNPENDSVPVLHEYAESYHADPNKWHFLTGAKKDLYDLARHGYMVTALDGDGGEHDFLHSEQLVLIDKVGRIRGFYNGTQAMETNKLIDDIKMLKFEDHIPRKKHDESE